MISIKKLQGNVSTGYLVINTVVSDDINSIVVKIEDNSLEFNDKIENEIKLEIPLATATNKKIKLCVDDVEILLFTFYLNPPHEDVIDTFIRDSYVFPVETIQAIECTYYADIDVPLGDMEYKRGLNDGLILGKLI